MQENADQKTPNTDTFHGVYENSDQNNSEYGHFLRSDNGSLLTFSIKLLQLIQWPETGVSMSNRA